MANITFTSDGGIDTSGPITSEGKNVLTTSDIYNGLDKLASGNALDARQGKVLNDAIEAISALIVKTSGNLVTGLGAGGNTSVSNGVVTANGNNSDTYFTFDTQLNGLPAGKYRISCMASGFDNDSQYYTYLLDNSLYYPPLIVKNGLCYVDVTIPNDLSGSLLIDDYDRPVAHSHKISGFSVVAIS